MMFHSILLILVKGLNKINVEIGIPLLKLFYTYMGGFEYSKMEFMCLLIEFFKFTNQMTSVLHIEGHWDIIAISKASWVEVLPKIA